jgi:hypothetical protein
LVSLLDTAVTEMFQGKSDITPLVLGEGQAHTEEEFNNFLSVLHPWL